MGRLNHTRLNSYLLDPETHIQYIVWRCSLTGGHKGNSSRIQVLEERCRGGSIVNEDANGGRESDSFVRVANVKGGGGSLKKSDLPTQVITKV